MKKNIGAALLTLLTSVSLGNCLLASSVFAQVIEKGAEKATEKAEKTEKKPHLDLAFCIDTTGSMQSEIDQVKEKVKSLTAKLAAGKPAPVVRVGLVAYRDRGDAYVTKVFPFTEDIDRFVKDVSGLQAAGGGDGPEAVNQGMHAALHDLKWDDDKHTAKLMFLIGDAPPHVYSNDFKWEDESRQAISRGIQVNTIACAGLESYGPAQGSDVFKQIAKLADGSADTLTYRQTVVDNKGKKETVVSFGGESYRVKSDSADWKRGVASLKAMGAADKMSPVVAREMSASAGAPGASFAMSESSRARGSMSGFSGGMSRGDSNLDEIVVQAAKRRAAKVSNVDYGGK